MSERSTTFLHGTSPLAALGIAVDGFRLQPVGLRFWGRGALGDGIYLTRSLAWAREFMRDFEGAGRGVVIRVALAPGTRVLWLDGNYDARRIDSLRREFGAGILRPDFHKALPRNKHLRARELIDVLNFVHAHAGEMPIWRRGWAGISGVRARLRRAKYSGFGCATTDLGVVVFDPAVLTPARIERFGAADELIPASPSWLLDAAAARLRDLELDHRELAADVGGGWWEPGEQGAERAELDRAWRQLSTLAQRHGLSLDRLV